MGKTSSKVKNRYNKKAYDRLYNWVPKGKKAIIQQAAQLEGKSLNSYVNEAIDEKMSKGKQT